MYTAIKTVKKLYTINRQVLFMCYTCIFCCKLREKNVLVIGVNILYLSYKYIILANNTNFLMSMEHIQYCIGTVIS